LEGKEYTSMNEPDDPAKKNSLLLIIFVVAGIAFLVFGIFVLAGIIQVEPGDGALNIIGGLVILATLPFIWRKKDNSN
jgi:hypothetical protein